MKDVPVLTSGAPADIATIAVPAGITRWMIQSSFDIASNPRAIGCSAVVESAVGTLASGIFRVNTADAGGGMTLIIIENRLTTAGSIAVFEMGDEVDMSTNTTLYLHQSTASANAGTVSFYLTIYPLP